MTDNITLRRAHAKVLRELLEAYENPDWWTEAEYAALAALDAALAEPERHVSLVCPQCNWTLQEPEPDATPEPATVEQVIAAHGPSWGPSATPDFFTGFRAAERHHGIRKEDGK